MCIFKAEYMCIYSIYIYIWIACMCASIERAYAQRCVHAVFFWTIKNTVHI